MQLLRGDSTMFRHTVPSLSTPVFVEALIAERRICLKTYQEIPEETFGLFNVESPTTMDTRVQRSLNLSQFVVPRAFPPEVSGIYFRHLPCMRLEIPYVEGGTLDDALAGRYFRTRSYSMIDLDDPAIGSVERKDAATWVIGVDYDGYARPGFNALAYEHSTKMHPLRAARQIGAPACLFVYQPFASVPFTECSMTLKFNQGLGFYSNVDAWLPRADFEYLDDMAAALPSLRRVDGQTGAIPIAPDGWVTVGLEMVDSTGEPINQDTTLHLEATGGYLPQQRVACTAGQAQVRVGALGLSVGEHFRVKAGFYSYTGLIDLHFEVTP